MLGISLEDVILFSCVRSEIWKPFALNKLSKSDHEALGKSMLSVVMDREGLDNPGLKGIKVITRD
jgi:hypothetical protein